MRTKIVYALTSDNSDFYYEQLLISLYSLRHYNPNAEVILVVDDTTNDALVDKRTKVLDCVSNVISVKAPEKYNKAMRSRFLKTNLRDIITGDYLFIDTDTVICDSLEEIDNCKFEIGAVLDNHHGKIIEDQLRYLPSGHEWLSLKGTTHYNSGVFFVKDTVNTHSFYQQWYDNWQRGAEIGFLYDQVPLRKTLQECTHISIGELDGVWNCQVFRIDSKPYWRNAKILHCQGITPNIYFPMTTSELYEEIKSTGEIPVYAKTLLIGKKEDLLKKRVIVYDRELDFYESPMHDVYFDYPGLFSFLVKVADGYRTLVGILWNTKNKLCK